MLSLLLSWLSGGTLDRILRHVEARRDSETASERLRTELVKEEIAAEVEARRNARDVRLATAGTWGDRLISAAIVMPFVVHLWAVGLDTIFGFGWRIASFPPPFDEHGWTIMLSYFGLVGVGRLVSGAVAAKRK